MLPLRSLAALAALLFLPALGCGASPAPAATPAAAPPPSSWVAFEPGARLRITQLLERPEGDTPVSTERVLDVDVGEPTDRGRFMQFLLTEPAEDGARVVGGNLWLRPDGGVDFARTPCPEPTPHDLEVTVPAMLALVQPSDAPRRGAAARSPRLHAAETSVVRTREQPIDELHACQADDYDVRPPVIRLIQRSEREIRQCYERSTLPEGRLVLQIVVGTDGSLDPSVASSELTDSGLAECIVGVLRGQRLEVSPPRPTTASFPFVFASVS